MANLTGSPYYDDYNSSKSYTKILAIPGRVLQAREFNQIQTMIQDQIARISNAILKNGTIIKGCTIVVNNKRSATITSGQIYLDGKVRDVAQDTVIISGIGIEYIGAYIVDTVITEDGDSTLRDPVVGNDNYGEPGAHRLKEVVKYIVVSAGTTDTSVVAHSNVAKLFMLVDGVVVNASNLEDNPVSIEVLKTMARRSFDENGSYKVRGIDLSDRNEYDDTGIYISAGNGKAYVNGYEVDKITSSKLKIDYCSDVFSRYNESIIYQEGTDIYNLDMSPVRDFITVSSQITVTEVVTRGRTVNGSDMLQHYPIYEILEISDNQRTYKANQDYVKDGAYVSWSPSGNEPGSGNSYYVTYVYTKNMSLTTDVKLINAYNEDTKRYESKIQFINDDFKPRDGTRTYFSYNYYLARADLVTLDQDGVFHILKGIPNILNKAAAPINKDDTTLNIGTVLVSPGFINKNCDPYLRKVVLTNYNSTRLSQSNLRYMKERLDNLEYNQAMSDLDEAAMEGEQATKLKGILTDGFIGLTKCDVGHAEFNCCIDVEDGYVTLPLTSKEFSVNIKEADTDATQIGYAYIAPCVQDVALDQAQATEAVKVNPYAVYESRPIISISPLVDKWIDSDTIYVQNITTNRWQIHYNNWSNANEKSRYKELTGLAYNFEDAGQTRELGIYNDYKASGNTTEIVLDTLITYMRQIPIIITGTNFKPNADNLVCYFNNSKIDIVPDSGYSAGTTVAGSIKANSLGRFVGTIQVPEKTPCGTVEVKITNDNDIVSSTIFTAIGRKITEQITSEVVKVSIFIMDPVAQSFQFDNDTILTRLGLYFKTKDPNSRIIVQVRNMINGYPGVNVLDEIIVESGSIIVSDTGTSETVVRFNRPVFCRANTQYCFTILTNSDKFEMWAATLGDADVFTGYQVVTQPYTAGVLFTSSNNQTWTAHQMSDLKFRLHKANFAGKGTVVFNPIETGNMTSLILTSNDADYKNDGINWYFKANDSDSWKSISPYNELELTELANTAYIKAELNSKADGNTSPILYDSTIDVIALLYGKTGAYVSRTVYLDNPFNAIHVSFEASIPTGTNIRIYYSLDNTNWTEMSTNQDLILDYNWSRYSCDAKLDNTSLIYKVKIEMSSNSNLYRPKVRRLMNILRNE